MTETNTGYNIFSGTEVKSVMCCRSYTPNDGACDIVFGRVGNTKQNRISCNETKVDSKFLLPQNVKTRTIRFLCFFFFAFQRFKDIFGQKCRCKAVKSKQRPPIWLVFTHQMPKRQRERSGYTFFSSFFSFFKKAAKYRNMAFFGRVLLFAPRVHQVHFADFHKISGLDPKNMYYFN